MHIAVIGATGRLGREALRAARDRGSTVTAHARRPMTDSPSGIRWVTGDAGDAVQHADAVLVLFGSRNPSDEPFCAAETGKILAGMRRHGVTRILCVTGALVGDYPANRTFCFQRLAAWLQRRYAKAMEDRAQQETLIQSSGMNWTLLKPPRLTMGLAHGTIAAGPAVRVGMLSSIARTDLARFMIEEVEQGRLVGQCLFVKRKR